MNQWNLILMATSFLLSHNRKYTMSKQVKVLTRDEIDFLTDLMKDFLTPTQEFDAGERLLAVFENALVVKVEYDDTGFFSK